MTEIKALEWAAVKFETLSGFDSIMAREITASNGKDDEQAIHYKEKTEKEEEIVKHLLHIKDRLTPKKPKAVIDGTWGTKKEVHTCPRCGGYLSNMEFIGDGEKVSYCEYCGQAIAWSGI